MSVETVKNAYKQYFGNDPQILVRAPGRINLIGEHTDYNEGFVFPAAVDKEIVLAFGLSEEIIFPYHFPSF